MKKQQIRWWYLFLFLLASTLVLIGADRIRVLDTPRAVLEMIIARMAGETRDRQDDQAILKARITALEKREKALTEENEDLRRQLQAPLPASFAFIPAQVLFVDGIDAIMQLGVGSLDNVEVGMPVVRDDILVGVVAQVTPRFSQVRLLAHEKSKIAVRTDRGARGLVMGKNVREGALTNVMLDRVLQGELLEDGDQLLTSGEDELPPNLLVGVVGERISQAHEPFQRAIVTVTVDPRMLARVFVVKI